MSQKIKIAFSALLLLFVFVACNEDDDAEVVNKYFEVTIGGQNMLIDLSAGEYTSGFNIRSFNYFDNIATEEDEEDVISTSRAGLASEDVMFEGTTVQLTSFSFYNETSGMDYKASEINMSLTVNSIDAFDQILDADFEGTFTDETTGENVTVNGRIDFGSR